MLLLAIDPTIEATQVIGWAAGVISVLASLLAASYARRANKAEKKLEDVEEEVQALKLSDAGHKAFKDVAVAEVNALKRAMDDMRRDVLTEKYFKIATDSQNQAINHTNEVVAEIKEELRALEKSKASKSEMNMLAARPAAGPPPRRYDGAYAVVSSQSHSSTPPPVRAKLPSQTF